MCERRPNAYGTVTEHTARLTQRVLVAGTKSNGKKQPPVTFPFYWSFNGNPGILIMADNNPYKTGSYKLLYTVFLFIAHMSSSYYISTGGRSTCRCLQMLRIVDFTKHQPMKEPSGIHL